MIILPPTNVEWTGDDAAQLKNFLQSSTGARLLQVLALFSPDLLDGGDVNKTLVASGQLAGYQEAINTIWRLTYEKPIEEEKSPASSGYQSLDDDEAWKDDSTVDKSTDPTTS
jgi:hypothetical protein